MRAAVISFTRNGATFAKKIVEFLSEESYEVTEAVKCASMKSSISMPLAEWTKEQFERQDALIFIGAAGIAVRAIGPLLQNKCQDPAVLVMDEKGQFCIPVLSGHIGGGNALARKISEAFGMQAVLTTATDVQDKWAVDVFAVRNHLVISDMKKAKAISARLLEGEILNYCMDAGTPVRGICPKEVRLLTEASEDGPDIYIGIYKHSQWKKTLFLIPKTVVMGLGCKKGTSTEVLEATIAEAMEQAKIFPEAINSVASIDLKAEEKGILAYCEKYHLNFSTYPAEALSQVTGSFSTSDFVKKITGVDNICERSAVCASDDGTLIFRKYARNGVTVAFAVKQWEVSFE